MVTAEEKKSSVEEVFGPVIHSYSRAEAIEDGVLIDLTGNFPSDTRLFKWPVACTSRVWERMEAAAQKQGNDLGLCVWDICYMAIHGVISRPDPSMVIFQVALPLGGPLETLKMVCGPGDHGEPVLTVMLPDED